MTLTIDIGTSSLKGGVFSRSGELLFCRREILPYRHGKDFNAEWWLEGLSRFLGAMEEEGHIGRTRIEGVAVSGHGPTLVPVGSDGLPTAPVLMWYDGRAALQDSPSFYLPRAVWFKDHYPDLYHKTDLFFGSAEYLVYRLSGLALMATSGPAFSPHLWDDLQLEAKSLDKEKFPSFYTLGDSCPARLSREGAALCGLTRGIPIYSGGSDFFTALLGSGAVKPGILCDRAGSSEGLNMICRRRADHDHIRFLPHPAGDGICNGSVILSSTGSLFEWYRRLTGQEDWSYEDTMEGIDKADRNSCPDFFPSFDDGGLWEFSGGLLLGLEPSMDRFALGRSVLEAIGFALKRGMALLEEEAGPVERFIAVGGQAKSRLWNQMKADMLGRAIEIPRVADAELLGNLAVYLTGEGDYSSLEVASLSLFRAKELVEPSDTFYYKEKFRRYGDLSRGVGDFYRANREKMERL